MKIKLFFKEHPIVFAIAYTCLYLTAFGILENIVTSPLIIHCAIDDMLPFCEYFIIPYIMWFLYIPAVFLFIAASDRTTYWKMAFSMFGGMTICVIIYILIPNGVDLRQTITGDNIFCRLVEFIRTNDTSTNVCPSIHVLNTLCVNQALWRTPVLDKKRGVRIASGVLAVFICLSTVMLDQHSVIDVLCAILLFTVVDRLAYRYVNAEEKEKVRSNV